MTLFINLRRKVSKRKIPQMLKVTTRILMMIKKNKRMNKKTMLKIMRKKRTPKRNPPTFSRSKRNPTNRTPLKARRLNPLHKTKRSREKMRMKKSISVENLIIISNYLVKTYPSLTKMLMLRKIFPYKKSFMTHRLYMHQLRLLPHKGVRSRSLCKTQFLQSVVL